MRRGGVTRHGAVIFDGFSQQLPDIDPRRRPEWLDSLDAVADARGKTRARFLLHEAPRAGPRAAGRLPGHGLDPLHQHHPARAGALVPGRRAHRAPHPGLHPLERGGHGHPGQQAGRRASAATCPPTPARPPSTRSASTTSSGARTTASPATRSSSRATPPPASTPGPSSRAASTEDQLDHFRQEIGGDGPAPATPTPGSCPTSGSSPPSPWASGPINSIYQARFNRYLLNRAHRRHQPRRGCGASWATASATSPRRLGALTLAAREQPRQPHLRRQLQPPAPRRPGAGQRQDHPGAGGALPGRGLERHQGHLGLEVGRAAGPRRRRRPRSTR